jgi:hypothetical protein
MSTLRIRAVSGMPISLRSVDLIRRLLAYRQVRIDRTQENRYTGYSSDRHENQQYMLLSCLYSFKSTVI